MFSAEPRCKVRALTSLWNSSSLLHSCIRRLSGSGENV